MDRMIGGNNFYPQNQERVEYARHTIAAPTPNYSYNQIQNPSGRSTGNYDYNRETQESLQNTQTKGRSSQLDLNPQPLDLNSTVQNEGGFEAPSTAQLLSEIHHMRAQQDKILENQNIFQTYITNEITAIKNRLNQFESDLLLSKTLSNSANPRNMY